jgi:hypothetical protein
MQNDVAEMNHRYGKDVYKKCFSVLDLIRDSGKVNMFGAAVPLAEFTGVSKRDARKILAQWMESFENGDDLEQRVNSVVLEFELQKSIRPIAI